MNAYASNAAASYRSAEVETLSQRDLLIKLFQGAERFLTKARLAMVNNQFDISNDSCQKARRIFMELLATLNFEVGGELASNLRDLYLFIVAEIVEANVRRLPERLEALVPVITTLREGWEGVPDAEANTSSLQSGAVNTFNVRT